MNIKVTRLPVARKRSLAEVVEINQPIARKSVGRETQSVFIKIVRERIARAWWRGVMTRDLAAQYRVSRPELEHIVHEELHEQFASRGEVA